MHVYFHVQDGVHCEKPLRLFAVRLVGVAIWIPTHACPLLYSKTNISETLFDAREPTFFAKFVVAIVSGFVMCSLTRFMFIPLHRFAMFFSTPFCSPQFFGSCSFPQCLFAYHNVTFNFNQNAIQQKQKFSITFHPHTLTPSPTVQVQQSGLSQAAGDRGVAKGA